MLTTIFLHAFFFREILAPVEIDEEAHWQVKLKHVEFEEEKSPSPVEKPIPEPQEIERLEYHPAPKRERPEVSIANNITAY